MTSAQTTPLPRHVFVYGTLRRGEQRDINLLKPAPRYVGPARVAGALFDLGDYPGLRLDGQRTDNAWVCGEVYEISSALEELLDEIEGIEPKSNGEYSKREVRVQPASGGAGTRRELVCLVYEVSAGRTAHCRVIGGGDWVSYRLQRGSAN